MLNISSGILIGLGAFFLITGITCFCYMRKKKSSDDDDDDARNNA